MSETSGLVPPREWADFHHVHVATAYRLLASGRLPYINVAAGTKKPTYRIRLDQAPEQPGATPLAPDAAASQAEGTTA